MILYILGSLITLFAIHLANIKLARNESQKLQLGTALFLSIFSFYGLVFLNIYILVQGMNEVLKDTKINKIFKGEINDSVV